MEWVKEQVQGFIVNFRQIFLTFISLGLWNKYIIGDGGGGGEEGFFVGLRNHNLTGFLRVIYQSLFMR